MECACGEGFNRTLGSGFTVRISVKNNFVLLLKSIIIKALTSLTKIKFVCIALCSIVTNSYIYVTYSVFIIKAIDLHYIVSGF